MRAVLLLATVCLGVAAGSKVVDLTDDDFDTFTGSSDVWLVMFHAPWCGHCKHLKPIFADAASESRRGKFAQVDATEQTGLASRFDVNGYPTLLFTPDAGSSWQEFDGDRSKEAFITFMDRMAAPAVTQLDSGAALAAFTEAASPVGFVLCDDAAGSLGDTYTSVANQLRHALSFAALVNAEVCAVFEASTPFVAKVEAGEAPVLVQDAADASEELLSAWVNANKFPIVTPLSPFAFRSIAKTEKLLVVAVVHEADLDRESSTSATLMGAVKTVARQPLNQFLFAQIDAQSWAKWVAQFLKEDDIPGVFVLDISSKLFYSDPQVNEVDELETFLELVLEGKVPAQRQGGSWFSQLLDSPGALALGAMSLLAVVALVFLGRRGSEDDEAPVDHDKAE